MADDDPVIRSYRKAVAAMNRLKKTDPLNWEFQANMHGAKPADGEHADWRWCMHSNWWFLPWHRGYLYYFERIVRKVSEDDAFCLPYWPWEKPGGDVLPEPFRTAGPANDPNPLYDGTRFPQVNAGQPIRRPDLPGTFASEWGRALRVAEFTTPYAATSYGGPQAKRTTPPQRPDELDFGVMESRAHNAVHVCVAPSKNGNMSDPDTAARDPIFWPHHANVDRLWNRWLDVKGHYNPEDADWTNQEFPFYDETGKRVVVSVGEILDRAGNSYRYDDDTVRAFGEAPRPVQQGKPVQRVESPVASAVPMLALGATRFSKPLTFEAGAKPRLVGALADTAPATAPPPTVLLRVEKIEPPADADVLYEVFVTKAGGKPAAKYYLGPITFFGRGGEHGHGRKDFTQAFDATDVLQQIKRENKGELPELEVAIVPHSTNAAVSDEDLAKQKIKVPISNITLRLVGDEKK